MLTGIEELCSVDSGYMTMTDAEGMRHSVYMSVTRDGSVWLRAGQDNTNSEWVYVDESRIHFQTVILAADDIHALQVLVFLLSRACRRRYRCHESPPCCSIPCASLSRRQVKIQWTQVSLHRSEPRLSGTARPSSPICRSVRNAGLQSWSWYGSARLR